VCRSFWEQDDALSLMKQAQDVFWLDPATVLINVSKHPLLQSTPPRNHPDAKVPYRPKDGHFTSGRSWVDYSTGCYMETWEVGESMARHYAHPSNDEAMRQQSLHVCSDPSLAMSKLRVTLDIVAKLRCGLHVPGLQPQQPHWKFVVVAVFLTTLNALQHVFLEHCPDLRQYRYDGTMSTTQRSESLLKFKQDARGSVMFLGAQTGGLGLSIVASVMIIYELPGSAKDYNQLRCRLIRPGNPFTVQIITLQGPVQAARDSLHDDHRELTARLGLTLA